MSHETALVATVAASLGLALVFGLAAVKLRLQALTGYLLAGVLLGPHTPGLHADPKLSADLAEIGVVLLMFGVGLHFSLKDLAPARSAALTGAAAQTAVITAAGALAARAWGWPPGAGLIFGLSLSVASTVVLTRALEQRGRCGRAPG